MVATGEAPVGAADYRASSGAGGAVAASKQTSEGQRRPQSAPSVKSRPTASAESGSAASRVDFVQWARTASAAKGGGAMRKRLVTLFGALDEADEPKGK
jgi:hypothetical protein